MSYFIRYRINLKFAQTCTENVYLTQCQYIALVLFIMLCLFRSLHERRQNLRGFLSNCFFCRTTILCNALNDASER